MYLNSHQIMSKGITINTDASLHPEIKLGGYAFTIACDNFKISKSGKFKNKIYFSHHAEIMAIGNALATLLKKNPLPTFEWLVINTDCIAAMCAMSTPKDDVGYRVQKMLFELLEKSKIKKYSVKHVKAHTTGEEPRDLANKWCDRESRREMREAVMLKSLVLRGELQLK